MAHPVTAPRAAPTAARASAVITIAPGERTVAAAMVGMFRMSAPATARRVAVMSGSFGSVCAGIGAMDSWSSAAMRDPGDEAESSLSGWLDVRARSCGEPVRPLEVGGHVGGTHRPGEVEALA